jgi:hypothetical protein
MDKEERMNFIIIDLRGIIRATLIHAVILLLILMVGSLRLPGLIMP